MTTVAGLHDALPGPIYTALSSLIRRVRLVVALRGACAVVAAATITLLAAMGIDASLLVDSAAARWALALGPAAVTALVAALMLVRPLCRTFTLSGTARAVEVRHPEMQERISSAVELLACGDAPQLRGSEALIHALASQASRTALTIRPAREATMRPVRPFLVVAAGGVAIITALLVAWPEKTARVLQRVVLPTANLPNLRGDQLRCTPDTDVIVAEGERLTVEVEVLNGRVTAAVFRRRDPGGGRDVVKDMVRVTKSGDEWPRFAFTCPPASESFQYRIGARRALSRDYSATVIKLPSVVQVDLRYDYPAYMRRESLVKRRTDGAIRAVAGTTVTILVHADLPAAQAELIVNGKPAGAGEISRRRRGSVCTFKVKLEKPMCGKWAVRFKRRVGQKEFTRTSQPQGIEALADAAPTARIVRPENTQLRLRGDDRLPVRFAVSDDCGLAGAEMLIAVDGNKLPARKLKLRGTELLGIGGTTLDLGALAAAAGRKAANITFRLRAFDNLPKDRKGPQQARSRPFTISIDDSVPRYFAQAQLAQELKIRAALKNVLVELTAAKKDSAPLQRDLSKMPVVTPETAERIDRMRKHLGEAGNELTKLLDQVSPATYGGILAVLGDLSRHIYRAMDLAGQIRLTDAAPERGDLAEQSDYEIDRAISIANELLKGMDEIFGAIREAQEIKDLAGIQSGLAETKAAMEQLAAPAKADQQARGAAAGAKSAGESPPPMSKKAWQQAQHGVKKRLGRLVRQTPGALASQAARDAARSENLAATARQLARDQKLLAGDTSRVAQVRRIDRDLLSLAAQQQVLAEEAEKQSFTTGQAAEVAEAAALIKGGKVAEAIQKAADVEAALARKPKQVERAQVAADVSRQAEQLADSQKKLTRQAARAADDYRSAADRSQAAEQVAARRRNDAEQTLRKISPRLAALREAQRKLLAGTQRLEQDIAHNPAMASAKDTKASPAVDRTLKDISAGKLTEAAKSAAQALTRAEKLTRQVWEARKRADARPSLAKQIEQAAKAANAAKKASQDAAKAAAEAHNALAQADQKAKQAASAAKRAADLAAAAMAAADLAAVQNAPDKAARRKAANEAQARARDAAQQSQAARNQAASAARTAAAGQERAKQAAQKHQACRQSKSGLQNRQNRQSSEAAVAAKADKTAKDIAAAQKKITGELVKLGADEGKKIDQANADALKAEAEHTKQAEAAKQAAQRLAQLAQAQRQLAEDARSLRRASEGAAEARQAVNRHDPTAGMQRAAGNMSPKRAEKVGASVRAAANQAAELAKALRWVSAGTGPAAQAEAKQAEAMAKRTAANAAGDQAVEAAEKAVLEAEAASKAKASKSPDAAALARAAAEAARKAADAAQKAAQAAQEAAQASREAAKGAARASPAESAATAAQRAAKEPSSAKGSAARQLAEKAQRNALRHARQVADADRRAVGEKSVHLAARQGDLRKKMAELFARRVPVASDYNSSQLSRMMVSQAQVAKEAAELVDEVKKSAMQMDGIDTKAAIAASRADKAMRTGKTAEAGKQAAQAAEKFTELAGRLGAAPQEQAPPGQAASKPTSTSAQRPEEPAAGHVGGGIAAKTGRVQAVTPRQRLFVESRAVLAKKLAVLARREQLLAGQMKALAENRNVHLVALRQKDLASRTILLGAGVDLIRRHADELITDPVARQEAGNAAGHITQAGNSQTAAGKQLAAKQAAQAVGPQQGAWQSLAQAAEALEKLGRQLAGIGKAEKAKADKAKGDKAAGRRRGGRLAGAFEAADEAEKTAELIDAQKAALLLQELANRYRRPAGVRPGQKKGKPGAGGASERQQPTAAGGEGKKGVRLQKVDLAAAQLKAFGQSGMEWDQLPGKLRSDILQAFDEATPREYRELVKRYFEQLARRGALGSGETPE